MKGERVRERGREREREGERERERQEGEGGKRQGTKGTRHRAGAQARTHARTHAAALTVISPATCSLFPLALHVALLHPMHDTTRHGTTRQG